jgi:hypothetical protein
MTLSVYSIARGLQLLGGLAVISAILLMVVSPYCGSTAHIILGVAAFAVDLGAIQTPRARIAILGSLAKAVVVFTSILLLVSCAAPPVGLPPPLVPQGFGQSVLLWSAVPSILGALMRSSAR